MKKVFFTLFACLLISSFMLFNTSSVYGQTTVNLPATKDNGIFSQSGALSTGVGGEIIMGRTNGGNLRRALMQFDVSSIPANATITDVKVKLQMTRTVSGAKDVAIHKMTTDWGEGTSNGGVGAGSGQGATATTNDATWSNPFFGTATTWTTAGGDYTATASATMSIAGNASYTYTGANLVSDVQAWVTSGATNFGWIFIGDESSNKTTKHWATKENTTVAFRPDLEVTYTTPVPLSGVYTIGGAGASYATFTAAANDLATLGINGAVTFNVAAGVYTEFLSLPTITGSSATNTITFDGVDTALVTIAHDATTQNATIDFSGADYVTIKNMRIITTGTNDAWAVHLMNRSDFVTIDHCAVYAMQNITSASTNEVGGIIASASVTASSTGGDNAHNLTVSNNYILGGYWAVRLEGGTASSGNLDSANVVMNNICEGNGGYGLLFDDQKEITISGNTVFGFGTSSKDGIQLSDCNDFTVTGNIVRAPDYALAIFDGNFDAPAVNGQSLVANNMLYSTFDDALIADDINNANIFHNTCVSGGATSAGFYVNDITTSDVRNNIFYSMTGDAMIAVDAITSADATVDFNVYHSGSAGAATVGGVAYATLADWIMADATLNPSSIQGDPLLVNVPMDLHTSGMVANDVGDNTVGIMTDIDGDARPLAPSTTVDIGADEYTPSAGTADVMITEISYNPPEGGSDTLEYIELYNNGNAAADLTGWSFANGVTYTFPSISLNPGDYLVVAIDSMVMLNNFGVTAYQWTSGGLSNGGEIIKIIDGNLMTIDSVKYDDNTPWSTFPDGNGSSVVLCDYTTDNADGANWSRAYTDAGFMINGKQVFGSPTAINDCVAPVAPTNPYPLADIGVINTTDANGVADSLGNKYEVRGVVYSIDFDGNTGYSFALVDPTGGITAFNFNDVDSYVVTQGDSIHVKGQVGQFNGLTQFVPDSIMLASQGNTLNAPMIVTTLDETTESNLVRINGVSLVTPSQWLASGSFNVDLTDGTNTYVARIDGDTDISGTAAPSGTFDIIGIGGQFDNSNPYTDGYQLFPRSLMDIITAPITATNVQFSAATTTVAEDIGTVTIDVTIVNPNMTTASSVDVVLDASSTATAGTDFTFTTPTTVTFAAGSSANQTVSVVVTDDMMSESTETIVLALTNASTGVSFGVDSVMTIDVTDNDFTITNSLILTGIYDGPVSSSPKGYEFYVANNIADLSIYGVGAANNGGGSDGIEFTFPAVSATAGDYIYLANDTAAFSAFFGFAADYEHGQSTGINGDDAVELFENGQVIDLFGDIDTDGTGEAWEYLDTWAYRNCSTGPDTTFNVNDWTIAALNMYDNQTTNATSPTPMPIGTYTTICPQNIIAIDDVVDVAYNTVASFNPIANDNTPSALIGAGISTQPTNGTLTLNIITQMMDYTPNANYCGTDMAEYFICDINGCDTAMITFNIACPIPAYDIATVVTNDADGNPDSLGVACELQGIVYGIDYRGTGGYSFTMIDATDGINVFAFNDSPSGYTVTEGDEIRVVGTIGFFNGLTEVIVDSVELVSTGNTLKTPTIVTSLGEATESDLVKVEAVTLVDPTQWALTGSFNVDVRNTTDTITIRIDDDCDIVGQPAPTGWFNVTGIGGQFDNSSPYTSGYQIFPRYQSDIELISNTNAPTNLAGQIRMFPNPTSGFLNIVSEINITNIRISNVLGQEVMTVQSPNATAALNVSNLTQGVYIITFTTEKGTWTEQFVKN